MTQKYPTLSVEAEKYAIHCARTTVPSRLSTTVSHEIHELLTSSKQLRFLDEFRKVLAILQVKMDTLILYIHLHHINMLYNLYVF